MRHLVQYTLRCDLAVLDGSLVLEYVLLDDQTRLYCAGGRARYCRSATSVEMLVAACSREVHKQVHSSCRNYCTELISHSMRLEINTGNDRADVRK